MQGVDHRFAHITFTDVQLIVSVRQLTEALARAPVGGTARIDAGRIGSPSVQKTPPRSPEHFQQNDIALANQSRRSGT